MKIDKELRIGDVIQLDDEWYQCVECKNLSCKECDLKTNEYVCDVETPHCKGCERRDNKEVVYKKLEKIGEPIEYSQGRMFQNLKSIDGHTCTNCDFIDIEGACRLENCAGCFYKEIKDKKKNEKNMEIKSIVVPDGWECIVKNGVATFQEKKQNIQNPPRSWEEFCTNYPVTLYEYFICGDSSIEPVFNPNDQRDSECDKNICASKEEAEAFLALMQLRQLRKAWVGDWEITDQPYYCIIPSKTKITVLAGSSLLRSLSFPTKEMAEDFLNCFRDLCEAAKILL